MNIVVNAIGDACPLPVVKTMKAAAAMTEPGILEVHVDNEIAVQNLNRFASGRGYAVSSEKKEEKHYVVKMAVSGAGAEAGEEEPAVCTLDLRSNLVIAIGSSCMGSGDDQLGATLMKAYIYAVSQQEQLPKTILFYNGGAKLTVEGAVSVEDLKNMEAQGVEILTCGTCLNFYGLQDKLAVGGVTNMYDIVERLTSAGKVIRV